ncbi:MAG: hypothetical protein JWQ80_46 [Massilia sp.]|nr:hypothetical protein [Massilia sp.]
MATQIPRDVLLQVLRASGRSMRDSVRLSRRQFLAATAAASAAAPALVAAAPQDRPKFQMAGRVLQVSFRGNQWDIDSARFGEHAEVEIRRDGVNFRILLSRAHYPGTNLRGNVQVRIFFDGARWRIALEADATNQDPLRHGVEPPLLEDWMQGKASFELRRKTSIRVGQVTISPDASHFACTVDASLRLHWRGPAHIALQIGHFKAAAGTLDASAGTDELLQRTLGNAQPRSFTTLAFESTAQGIAGINLARVAGTHRIKWDAPEPRLGLIAFDSARARNGEALVIVEASGALELNGRGLTERGAKLLLDKTVLMTWASAPASQVQLAYTLQHKPNFMLEADGFALEVAGPAEPVTLDIRQAALARFDARVNLHAAHVPVRGASMASVAYAGLPMAISVPHGSGARDCSAFASFGGRSLLDLPLEKGTLHLQRSADLFDLRFEFRNYRLECAGGKTTLFERWAYGAGCEANRNPPTLIAVFWPQHVQEEVFVKKQRMSAELRSIDTLKFPADLARTAVAAPSRVAMQGVEPRENWQQGVELTIEQITDWEELTLAVHARALPADAPLEQQLRAIQLDPQATRTDARHAIFASLTSQPSADQTALEAVTGLVVSPDGSAKFATPRTRPAAGGAVTMWTARLRLGKNSAVRALHARQVNFGFLSGTCTNGKAPTQQELHEFFATLRAQDRAELVALMSAYAMPSLRRLLRDKEEGNQFIDDPKGMIVRPSKPLAFLSNATKPYPVPNADGTDTTLDVLQEGILVPRGFQEFELTMSTLKGTLRSRWEGEPPAPLDTDPFFASALNVEGYIHRTVRGRDALVQVAYKGFLFPLGHRAALIEVSERPFSPARGNADMLDPTAYLIRRQYIVTRKPEKNFPALGQPFQGREFPATRVEMMTVVTPEIVDVLNAKDERLNLGAWLLPDGRIPSCVAPGRAAEESIGRVFWPRSRPGTTANDETSNVYGHEVQFEYRLDGVQQPLRSALVFVDNTAAHHAITMQALVRYYEALPYSSGMMEGKVVIPNGPVSGLAAKEALRLAVTGSVERRYAPALKSGETSFQTEYWVLGATGGAGTQNGAPLAPIPLMKRFQGEKSEVPAASESFSMDALMEGADQPPFYPRVHRAYIKMQSLDRLLGRPQGLIEVGYAKRYVVHAMEAAANPSTIYLDVLAPAVDLDVSGQGDASGGVAKPNARLAAISRSLGMVGGRPLPKQADASKALVVRQQLAPVGMVAGAMSSSLSFDTSAAQAGNFDPAEFFGGALTDAMLLGIIPLKDVIRVVAIGLAPKLREVTEYASEGLDKALPEIARAIESTIRSAISTGNDAARAILGSTSGAAIADPFQEFYPALASRATRLQQVCARIATLPSGELKQQFGALAGELIEAGKDFAQAVEEVAKNPMPKGLAEYVQKLRNAAAALQKLSDPAELRKFVVEQVRRFATQLFANLAEHLVGKSEAIGVLDIVFGVDPGVGQGMAQRARVLHEIVTDPQAAVDRLRHSVLQDSLPGLFVQAFSRLEAIRRQVEGILAIARSEVIDEVVGLMAQGDAYLKQIPTLRKVATEFVDAAAKALEGFDAADALRRGGLSNVFDQAKAKVQPEIVKLESAYTKTAYGEAQKAAQAEADTYRKQVKTKLDQIAAATQAQREALERDLRELEGMLAGWQRAASLLSLEDIEAKVRRAVDAELDRQTKALEDRARAAVEDVLGKVATDVVAAAAATFDSGANLIELVVRSADNALQAWCTGPGAAALAELLELLLGTRARIDKVLTAARKLHADLMGLDVPETVPSEARAEAQAQLALARRLVQQSIDQAELLLKRLPELPANPCTDAEVTAKLVRILDEMCQARLRLLDNIVSGMAAAARCQVLLGQKRGQALRLFGAARTDLCARIKETLGMARALVVPSASAVAALRARVDEIEQLLPPQKKGVLAALLQQLDYKAADVGAQLDTISQQCENTAKALDELARRLEEQRALLLSLIEGEERRLASFVMDLVLSKFVDAQKAMEALGNSMVAVSGFVGEICKVHVDLEKALVALLAAIRGAASDSALGELLATIARPGLAALDQAREAVGQDAKLLTTVQTALAARDAPAALAAIRSVQASWADPGPGLARAANLLARVLQSLMRGQLASLFDFNAVRDEIQRRLLELLPTRIHQTYDFDTRLEDFPSGDPVFQINRGASPDQLPLANAKNDLVLETSVEVDLVKNTRRATLKGTIRPFDIRLLGNRLDLATVKFKGARFEASTDTKPTYEADLLGVEIGSMLQFIKALQDYFSPKPGNGPYFGITLFPPEAVAGYGYAAPTISVGTLFFLNIAIAVSMHLPFDNRQAYFRFGFASRELPFLIFSLPCYGGGGCVALLANAKGIVGFEIQIEFGAVVPIEFGPLSAQGRVTAGIYLMSGVGTRVLEGFVSAVGEGNIACFGVSVSIVVRVRQQDGGAMQGSSTYSMSFKVGIATVSYSFSAQYTIQGGASGGESKSEQSVRMFGAAPVSEVRDQWITTRVPPKQSRWKDYRAHVALEGARG